MGSQLVKTFSNIADTATILAALFIIWVGTGMLTYGLTHLPGMR
jgi:putative Mn2+ efflux pump MntP